MLSIMHVFTYINTHTLHTCTHMLARMMTAERWCKNAVIWITGDTNLPHVDWNNHLVSHAPYPTEIYNLFMDTLNSGGFTQKVETSTRGNNILDIFATNSPALTNSVDVIPGISDHEMIRVTSNLSPVLLKPNEWKIYLWNKTDFNQLNLNMTQFSETFLHCYTIDTPIQDLWDIFKMQCYDCLDLVPHIFSAKPDRNPWINNYVKWFTNKKQHLYNRA